MDTVDAALLLGGGLIAGFLNTVAGGGSMLTLPLLSLAGLPPDVANGTNRVAILLQNVAATWGFRSHGVRVGRVSLVLGVPACAGAILGAWLAVWLDPSVLERIFGVLLAVLAVLVLLQPGRFGGPGQSGPVRKATTPGSMLVFFGVGVYGGFIQAGVGFLFLTGLVLWMNHDLVRANAIKVMVVLMYTACALVVFIWGGKVAPAHGAALALGNMMGGYFASVLSVRKGSGWVRIVLVFCALAGALKFLGAFSFAGGT